MVHRRKTWELLAGDWKIQMMNEVTEDIVLSELNDSIDKMLKGGHKGRSIISMLD
jgi:acrylyl-CoA reductase (NADPH)